MPFLKLQFRPGLNKDTASYADEGGWNDCDKIRFRMGYPETIGGWDRLSNFQFLGSCRALHPWTTLSGTKLVGVGTNLKYYILSGGAYSDVTPLRLTTAAGDVTFSATDGSSIITISDIGHGALINDFVTFSGAVSLGGNIIADVLNAEYQVLSVINADSYTIDMGVTANASDTGNGGSSTVGAYQINVGLDTSIVGTGWGAGPYGADGWGVAATTTTPSTQLRIWSHDNYGEDLVMNVHDGGIFYWDQSGGLLARAVALSSLPGANTTPTIAKKVFLSDRDRHLIAFGCDDEFSIGTQDPLLIRFSDQESLTQWASLPTNTAGSLRISTGSEIITAVKTKQQSVIFTDVSVHVMQYIGAPFTFGLNEVATGTTIISQNSAISVNDNVFWMGMETFYVYNGTVQQIACPVLEYVFNDFNTNQSGKVIAGHNAEHSEIWWFYPSANSDNNDKYVVYNYSQNIWYFGNLGRSAWIDRGVFGYPIAASLDGYLYYHEFGINDGSQNPPVGIESYIESKPVDLGEGDQFMFVSRIVPDMTFRNSQNTPSATMTLKAKDFPGSAFVGTDSQVATRSVSLPVEQYTGELFVRIRGRSMAFRIESDQLGTAWRLGAPRIEVRPDGRR
jgi:hypothetical protein